jgi:hypothetical protein
MTIASLSLMNSQGDPHSPKSLSYPYTNPEQDEFDSKVHHQPILKRYIIDEEAVRMSL